MSVRIPARTAVTAAAVAGALAAALPSAASAAPARSAGVTVSAQLAAEVRADLGAKRRIERAVQRIERAEAAVARAQARGQAQARVGARRVADALAVASQRLRPLLASRDADVQARAAVAVERLAVVHADVAASVAGQLPEDAGTRERQSAGKVVARLQASLRTLADAAQRGAEETREAVRAALLRAGESVDAAHVEVGVDVHLGASLKP